MNVIIEYLYRDSGNNKIWGEACFSNKHNICRDELLRRIKNKLIDGEFFVAEKAGLNALHFEQYDQELDHGWHEFFDIKISGNKLGSCNKDITYFIEVL